MDFILSLLPNALTIIAVIIEFIAKFIMGIAAIFLSLSVTLHKLFKTKVGIALLKMEESTKNILAMYSNIAKQIADNKTAQVKEANKLADAAKSDTNVVQLGKKKDDST